MGIAHAPQGSYISLFVRYYSGKALYCLLILFQLQQDTAFAKQSLCIIIIYLKRLIIALQGAVIVLQLFLHFCQIIPQRDILRIQAQSRIDE